MFSCREITSGYIKKHAHKTLANIQIKSFSLRSKHFLNFTNKYCFCGYHATSSCCQSTTRLQSQYFSQNIVLWETLFLFSLQNITMTNLVLIFHVKVLKNLNISLLLDLNLKVKKNLNIPQMSRQGLAAMPIWGQICFLGAKKPNFYWRNQKFCYPHNGNPP